MVPSMVKQLAISIGEAGSFLTIFLEVSARCLSLDLLLAIVTLQKFMGKEIKDGILGSFNIFNINLKKHLK